MVHFIRKDNFPNVDMGLRVWCVSSFFSKSKLAVSVSQLEAENDSNRHRSSCLDREKCKGIKTDTVFLISQPIRMLHSHPFTVTEWWTEEYLICILDKFLDRQFFVLERIQPLFLPPLRLSRSSPACLSLLHQTCSPFTELLTRKLARAGARGGG